MTNSRFLIAIATAAFVLTCPLSAQTPDSGSPSETTLTYVYYPFPDRHMQPSIVAGWEDPEKVPLFIEHGALLKKGQTTDMVLASIGKPGSIEHNRKDGLNFNDGNAVWYYGDIENRYGMMSVKFVGGKVTRTKKIRQRLPHGSRKIDTVLAVAGNVYLAVVCSQVRSKPVLLLTSYDVDTLQACYVAGF